MSEKQPTPEEAQKILEGLAANVPPDWADSIPKISGVIATMPQDPIGEMFQLLLEQIPAVTFMTSFEAGLQKVYVSPQIESMLGYSKGEWLARPSLWLERLHPDDRERWHREFADTVMTRGTSVRAVYRFLHRDGRVVWILGDVRIRRDKDGQPLFVQAVGFDVSELQRELDHLRAEVQEESAPDHALLGSSKGMEDVRSLIRKFAPSPSTVLITGENGVGKELVARSLHYSSPRSGKSMVELNCAALTPTTLESELFGHEKGAFTGATSRRIGRFEQAHGSTLFLDEIGDMPLAIQSAFLKVLDGEAFHRMGGDERIQVDVRVICATNHDLEEMVRKGAFRQDLYYRINTLHLEVPPLRDRAGDIPDLAEHLLARANRAEKRGVGISDEALALLKAHPWPGNVRELKHALERAVLVCDDAAILSKDLPRALSRRAAQAVLEAGPERLIDALDRVERGMIVSALEKSGWVKTRAAKSLGLNERVLTYKMNNLGIEKA